MTTIAMGSRDQLPAKIMNLMHAFRTEVFVNRLRWSLPTAEGLERDRYDTANAKYVVITDEAVKVVASARLLPTTGAYMLPDLFPQLLAGRATPRDARLWELSRFATSVRTSGDGRVLSLSDQTLDLLDYVFDLARQHDVGRLILATSVGIERLMLRTGLDAHRLAPPATVDGTLCVAVIIEVPVGGRRHAPLDATAGDQRRGNRRHNCMNGEMPGVVQEQPHSA
jgi:N-acyl-L-homoserine lactone synthetase